MPRTIVITGASDGIGAEAARRLAAQGDAVVLVGRSEAKTAAIAAELHAPHHVADFAHLDQVRALAKELIDGHPRIDILANNAGGIMGAREMTADGFEKTLQVDHLAGFLLTELLHDTLVASRATVINTSSAAAAAFGHLDLDDLENAVGYRPNKAYGDAKLANILHAKELYRRYGDQGINAVSFHPGNVATNFAHDTTSWFRFIYRTPLRKLVLTSPERGTATLLWLINGTPGQTWVSGQYYANGKPAATGKQVDDRALAAGLWDRSAAMVGV